MPAISEEAKARKRLAQNKVKQEFRAKMKAENRVLLTCYVSQDTHEMLIEEAKESDLKREEFLGHYIDNAIKKVKGKN